MADASDGVYEQIAKTYAKAFLGAAQKAGNMDQAIDELAAFIHDVLDKLPKLDAALASPRVPQEAKVGMIDKALAGRASRELTNFLKVVAAHDRFAALRAIEKAARKLRNEMQGRVEVVVKTADPVSPEQIGQIHDRLRAALGREIDLRQVVDERLIGGMLVRVGDTVYDGSVANQLSRLRSEMVARAAQEIRRSTDRFAQTNI